MRSPFGEIVFCSGATGLELSGGSVGFICNDYRDTLEFTGRPLLFEVSPIVGDVLLDETGAILTDESGDVITW